jgi:hypothetical protein
MLLPAQVSPLLQILQTRDVEKRSIERPRQKEKDSSGTETGRTTYLTIKALGSAA